MKFLHNKIGGLKKILLNQGAWWPSPVSVGMTRRGLTYNKHVVVSDEVRNTDRPLVALESTIITHGLPYPDNVKMALEVESMIKAEGAMPATIAFFNGKFRVGLSKDEIEAIASKHKEAIKISRRDIPYILASDKIDSIVGGTTVSATSIVANAAKIPIFCTGGIGGVHRDYNDSMDVSADLQELSRTPVAVISSGVKSILDIEKTLEYLETMGVCVAVLNKNGSKTFPSFFTSQSRFEAPYNALNEAEAARLIYANLTNGLTPSTGILIAVPIPEEYSADDAQIEAAITEALAEANKLNIKGKKVTPFLLDKLNKLTQGKSLASNLALIKNNARTSARIAVELQKLTRNDIKQAKENTSSRSSNKSVTVIGGANVDLTFKILCDKTLHMSGVTQPGRFNYNLGGVSRNMSEALIKLGVPNTKLITAVANDMMGSYVLEESARLGFDTSHIRVVDRSEVSTGSYCAVFEPNGELKLAIGDMKAHDHVTPDLIDKSLHVLKESEICVLDACMSTETIERICYLCNQHSIPVWYNPTDLRKCNKILSSLAKVTYISPNMVELFELFRGVEPAHQLVAKYKSMASDLSRVDFEDLKTMIKHLLNYVPFIFLSRGGSDLILASLYELDLNARGQLPLRSTRAQLCNRKVAPHLYLFPVLEFAEGEEKVNVSGAGDSASSAFIAGLVKDYPLSTLVYYGLKSAKLSIMSSQTISPLLANIDKRELDEIVQLKKSKIKTIVL